MKTIRRTGKGTRAQRSSDHLARLLSNRSACHASDAVVWLAVAFLDSVSGWPFEIIIGLLLRLRPQGLALKMLLEPGSNQPRKEMSSRLYSSPHKNNA